MPYELAAGLFFKLTTHTGDFFVKVDEVVDNEDLALSVFPLEDEFEEFLPVISTAEGFEIPEITCVTLFEGFGMRPIIHTPDGPEMGFWNVFETIEEQSVVDTMTWETLKHLLLGDEND